MTLQKTVELLPLAALAYSASGSFLGNITLRSTDDYQSFTQDGVGTNPLRSSPIPLVWYCQFDVSPVNYSADSDENKVTGGTLP